MNAMHETEEKGVVISLYDTTALMLKPWAQAGFECHAYDLQNNEGPDADGIFKHREDLFDPTTMDAIHNRFQDRNVVAIFAFPPCTDLSIAGARWWTRKALENPNFQVEAARRIEDVHTWCTRLTSTNPDSFFMIENPKASRLNSLWRKRDHTFSPNEYGGYLDESEHEHPLWPTKIPARDAYSKLTGLWTSANFKLPIQKPVEAQRILVKDRYHSPLFASFTSAKLRSATPRGFAKAVFLANHPLP